MWRWVLVLGLVACEGDEGDKYGPAGGDSASGDETGDHTGDDTGPDPDCDTAAGDGSTWYADADGDGAGDPDVSVRACEAPEDHVGNDDDCDDADASVQAESTWYFDVDRDGYGDPTQSEVACHPPAGAVDDAGDCDDADPLRSPDATEVCGGTDEDCDGLVDDDDPDLDGSTGQLWYADADGDGYYGETTTLAACEQPAGHVPLSEVDDCDDDDDEVNPSATEVCGNEVDDDCDGTGNGCEIESGYVDDLHTIQFVGEAEGDRAGTGVAVGDWNGDGVQDILVGASGEYGAGDVGAVYALTGGFSTGSVDLSTRDNEWAGGDTDSYYGSRLVSLGDSNGDSYDDWLVGAYGYDGSAGYAGYFRGARSWNTSPYNSITGTASLDYCGAGVGGGIDVTGDLIEDAIVGCPGQGGGTVYVMSGSIEWDVTAVGSNDQLGYGVDTVDMDGDGQGDLVLGAPGADTAYVFIGPITDGLTTASADDSFSARNETGFRVDAGGDLDDDGYDDVIVGTQDTYVYVLPGNATGAISTGGEYEISGTIETSVAGDLNADYKPDLVLGADSARGYVYVHWGPITTSLDAEDGVEIAGASGDEELGSALTVGDVDGDGIPDLVAGAPGYDTDAGAIYVLAGGSR